MERKKFVSFKEQMKKVLIFYSLIPIIITAILGYGMVYYLNFRGVVRKNNLKLLEVSEKLEVAFKDSKENLLKLSDENAIKDGIKNKKLDRKVYELLYRDKSQEKIEGRVVLYDKNFYPIEKKDEKLYDASWGIFYRMQNDPKNIVSYIGKTYFDNIEPSTYCIGKAVYYKKEIVGYIVYYYLDDGIRKIVGDLNGTGVIISDRYGNIIFSSIKGFRDNIGRVDKKLMIAKGYFKYQKKRYYIESMKKNDIIIYTISFIDHLVTIFKESLYYITIVFLILIFFMYKIARKIAIEKTETLSEIIKAIKRIESGSLNFKLDIRSNDEFEIIGKSYNDMLDNIKLLIKRNKEETQHSVISELKQLESQFNPHFLFNTLEMLRYSIYLDKKRCNKIILNMASILRYSIENKSSEVELEKELFYIKSYLELQKMRLENGFTYFLNIDKELENCFVPKLIFQPLIENSIKYGYTQEKVFTIIVRIKKRGKSIQIDIYDDGIGMTKETLNILREKIKGKEIGKGLGIFSVQRRIELLYGEKYGLKIYSGRRGSYIKIKIPLKRGFK